jgi:hypothetical protein
MLPILSFVIALTALALATVVSSLGWKHFQQSRERLAALTESLRVLRAAHQSFEHKWNQTQHGQSDSTLAISALRTSLENLEERFSEVESYAGVCVPPKPVNSGLNINRRVEAVRMLKDGHSEEQVAAELALALSEVRLIGHLEKKSPKPAAKRGRRVA